MEVVVNGRTRALPEGTTVARLIELLGLGSRNVVVERNGEPVERDRFGDVELAPDDVVEVVRAVQGG